VPFALKHYSLADGVASELRVIEVEAWPGNILGVEQMAVRQAIT